MIRIGIVAGVLHSGGKRNLIMEFYRHIDRSKVQFDFICDSNSNGIPYDEITSLGGRVYLVPPYKNLFPHLRATYKVFKENRYPIVHAFDNTLNFFPMLVARLAGVNVRISESISKGDKNEKKTKLKLVLRRFSHCFVTDYMANSIDCGKWQFGTKTYEAGKVTIFKSVIDTEVNKYNPELRYRTRKEYEIDDSIVLGHIGRLTEQKNTLFLIDIFNEVLKLERRAKLLIIGDGNLKDKMLEKIDLYGIAENIIYLGRREDIPQFYNAMDAFILPSLYEGVPVVGIEAENCGLPIFFSTEVARESSPCKELGFFIELDKGPEYWANQIIDITNKNIKNRYGREKIITKCGFNSKEEGKKLLDYYNSLLSQIGNK